MSRDPCRCNCIHHRDMLPPTCVCGYCTRLPPTVNSNSHPATQTLCPCDGLELSLHLCPTCAAAQPKTLLDGGPTCQAVLTQYKLSSLERSSAGTARVNICVPQCSAACRTVWPPLHACARSPYHVMTLLTPSHTHISRDACLTSHITGTVSVLQGSCFHPCQLWA